MSLSRLFTIVAYTILNAGTPVFVQDGKPVDYIDPESDYIKGLANSPDAAKRETGVLRISGIVTKGGKELTIRTLVVTAEKYGSPEFAYSDNADGSEITISVPEFAKGRNKISRKFVANAASVSGLRAMQAKRAEIAKAAADAAAKAIAKAEADAAKLAAKDAASKS